MKDDEDTAAAHQLSPRLFFTLSRLSVFACRQVNMRQTKRRRWVQCFQTPSRFSTWPRTRTCCLPWSWTLRSWPTNSRRYIRLCKQPDCNPFVCVCVCACSCHTLSMRICHQLQIKHAVTQAEIQLLKRKVRPLNFHSLRNTLKLQYTAISRLCCSGDCTQA